ncbi:MAG: hypothetical protein H7Z37_04615 [Pyrinomonadaceae bacterium]|nr:hypothetical protein [Pyrinomonadaceae bacterium]
MVKQENSSLTRRLVHAGGWQIAKRLMRNVPFAGTAVIIGLAGNDIRRKGLLKGALNVGLDVIPVVGTAKNVIELFTGDLISDKIPKSVDKNAEKNNDK